MISMSAPDLAIAYPYTFAVLENHERWALIDEDCLTFLRKLPDNSIDAVVTDPPAAISFMGRNWDTFEDREAFVNFLTERLQQCVRVLKPGGHALIWALPRTSHWTGWAIEDAGFEPRDRLTHVFGTGFNKSSALLKPAAEDWWLARKPFNGTIKQNLQRWGVGELNLDACRIATADKLTRKLGKTTVSPSGWRSVNRSPIAGKDGGRVPANFILSHNEDCENERCTPNCPVAELDRQSGLTKSRKGKPRKSKKPGDGWGMTKTGAEYNDEGGGSRFFYCAKPSRKEREAGLDGANDHPTVKSIPVMRWLCRLITPPNGVVLDPFAGSGTTGCAALLENFRFIGIEEKPDYVTVAMTRIQYWETQWQDSTQ